MITNGNMTNLVCLAGLIEITIFVTECYVYVRYFIIAS